MIETREVDGIRTVVLTEELVRALELVTRMMPVLQDLDQIVGTPAMISINDRLEIQNEQLQRLEHGEFHLLRRARRLEGIVMQKQNPA